MNKKLPTGEFKWIKKTSLYTEEAKKMYDENSDYVTILEVDIEYPVKERIKHKDLHFLPERRKTSKVHKLVTTADDKEKYVIHISLK